MATQKTPIPWQPISSAPEMQRVLVLMPTTDMFLAWKVGNVGEFMGKWLYSQPGSRRSAPIGWPVAWMPAPDLPSEEEMATFGATRPEAAE